MGADDDTPSRNASSVSHRDLQAAVDRFGNKLDGFMSAHAAQHAAEQKAYADLLVQAAVAREREERMERLISKMEVDVDHLSQWRSEVRGMTRLIQFAIGSSVVAAVVSGFSLIQLLRT